jgi:hypothetical protein
MHRLLLLRRGVDRQIIAALTHNPKYKALALAIANVTPLSLLTFRTCVQLYCTLLVQSQQQYQGRHNYLTNRTPRALKSNCNVLNQRSASLVHLTSYSTICMEGSYPTSSRPERRLRPSTVSTTDSPVYRRSVGAAVMIPSLNCPHRRSASGLSFREWAANVAKHHDFHGGFGVLQPPSQSG